MIKLSAHEVGKKALIILKFKIGRQGIDLRPSEFAQRITKNAQRIGCPREELLGFFNRFLIPEILHSCELRGHHYDSEPNEREAKIAFRMLKMGFFWDLHDLRNEVYSIVEKTPLEFNEVASIVTHIANRHLWDQFGEGEAVTLDISGEFKLD
ncbi:MAG: hypothetical protein WCS89_00660 [Candidatus Paceibacterota bacterium]|jgi:hypothetical protein